MAIILAIIAAVIVIAGLITFNVRNTSAGKDIKEETNEKVNEPAEQTPEVNYPAEQRAAEHAPSAERADSQKKKVDSMGDDIYRQALQKFKHSADQEEVKPESDKMEDSSYRDALLSMKNKKK
ncbi:hypothetical protein ACWNPK_05315 [Bacillus atrophaeus]